MEETSHLHLLGANCWISETINKWIIPKNSMKREKSKKTHDLFGNLNHKTTPQAGFTTTFTLPKQQIQWSWSIGFPLARGVGGKEEWGEANDHRMSLSAPRWKTLIWRNETTWEFFFTRTDPKNEGQKKGFSWRIIFGLRFCWKGKIFNWNQHVLFFGQGFKSVNSRGKRLSQVDDMMDVRGTTLWSSVTPGGLGGQIKRVPDLGGIWGGIGERIWVFPKIGVP